MTKTDLSPMGKYAQLYGEKGLSVLPVSRKTKKPFIKWGKEATSDLEKIAEWWKKYPNANIGIVMGSGAIDIETDYHDETDGEDSLKMFFEDHGESIPETIAFRSGGGGVHRLYKCDAVISSGTGILPGVDFRGNGGYAIMPPSIHSNGKQYAWLDGCAPGEIAIAELPQILLNLLLEKIPKAESFNEVPDMVIEGQRDDTLFRLASSLRAKGLTFDEMLPAVNAINEGRCVPPLDAGQVEKICHQAAQFERGAKQSDTKKPPDLAAHSVIELQTKHLAPLNWIVAEMLPQGLTLLASPPKYGKSWFVLDLCLSVAAGDNFLKHHTKKSDCLYLALEDSEHRLKDRVNKLTSGKLAPETFAYTINAQTLDTGLIEQLEKFITMHPNTALIVIDTLQKIRGVAQNKESGYAADYREIGALKSFADKHSISVLLVHHIRKMGDDDIFNRISGTNGIMGSVDTAMVLYKKNRSDEDATLSITGRDVRESETVLNFDKDCFRWKTKGTVEEIEERRLASEYANDPVIQTVRHLVAQHSEGWTGTMAALIRECLEFAGTLPDKIDPDHPSTLGQKMGSYAKMLLLRDSIGIVFPNKNGGTGGRKYRFFQKE